MIARKPWRVRVEQTSTNYYTECYIDVDVVLRHNSPVMEELLRANPSEITLENLAGSYGSGKNTEGIHTFPDDATDGGKQYKEPGLLEESIKLYTKTYLPMRMNAMDRLTRLTPHAFADKAARTWSDPATGQVNLEYTLAACEGYRLYSEEAVDYLKSMKKGPPHREHVVFYDLLPYGVRFDPASQVTAGRITDLVDDQPPMDSRSWSKSQIRVEIDRERDIISDYKGTGRTLLKFHVYYDGADASVYTDDMWMDGFGVRFSAYYDWKDADVVGSAVNIAAFMPAENDPPIIGQDTEVAKDDGIIVPSTFGSDYKDFGSDIDGDKRTDDTVLYARPGPTLRTILRSQMIQR